MRNLESWILSYLLNSLWQVPLLFAAGWVAVRAVRPVGAVAEHRLWVVVLLLQSVLPACPALTWERLRMLLAWAGGAPGGDQGHVSVAMGAGTSLGGLHLPGALLAILAFAYAAATAYYAAQFLWRWRRLDVLRSDAEALELTGAAAAYLAQCSLRFCVHGVSIATSARIFSPVTMGLSRKLLLMPASMAESLPGADLHAVIAHEFAHMRREDFLKNLIYEIVSLPVRYHPLFRLTRERIMETREIVCDQMAASIDGRNEYARSLLRLASLLVEGAPIRIPHTIGIFDADTFERRLMKLTENPTRIGRMRRMAIVAACAALGVATCGSALALRINVDTAANAGAKTPAYVNVSAREMAENIVSKVQPKYPPEAKKARVQGTVVLNATINKEGTVEDLRVVSGPAMLQQSSLEAVQQWVYKPYLLNGNPVAVKTTIHIIYTLEKK